MNAAKKSQLNGLTFAINDFHLKHLIRVYKAFKRDIESAIVLGEIAHHNARLLFPHKGIRRLEQNEIRNSLRGSNAHSISLSSGIPRETVRRKIKKLIDAGYITYNKQNHLVITALPKEEFGEFSKETLGLFFDFIDELRDDRLI